MESPFPDLEASFDLEAYEPPTSLWRTVEEHVPAGELEEVKGILGTTLVEQCMDLHAEVRTLLEIWQDYRDDTDQLIQRGSGGRSGLRSGQLPEPPRQRELIVDEIEFLLQNLKERANSEGRNVQDLLSKHNPGVIQYALTDKATGSRPGTGSRPSTSGSRPSSARSSRSGRETPLRRTATPSSDDDRMSISSGMSDQIDRLQDNLNVSRIDQVVEHLRQTLEQECSVLTQDIAFLQTCLEDEADFRSRASTPATVVEPSLGELKTERSLLEKELQSISNGTRTGAASRQRPGMTRSSDSRRSPMLPSPPTSAGKLRRSPVTGSGVRSGPMRAVHNITADLPSDNRPRQRPSTSSSVSTSPHSTPSPPPSARTPPARPSLPSRPGHSTPPHVPGRPSLRTPLSPSAAPRLLRYHVVEAPGVLPTLPSPPSSAKPTGARNPRLRKVVVTKDGGSS
ncbi:coiled-coil domain-containing protein 24-like isoform X2 [Branchiostoma floridae x Branchiostoma japonicum]